MQMTKQLTIAGVVTIASALVGMWLALDPWPTWGWEHPADHDADIQILQQQVIASMQTKLESDIANTQIAMQVFRDEWACSNFRKELAEMYLQRDGGNNSEQLRDQITDHRKVMNDRTCKRFGVY